MRQVTDSLGKSWSIDIKLGDVRRLKRGVETDQGDSFQLDLDFLDQELLQTIVDRILAQPLFCVNLTWALLTHDERNAMTFDAFLNRWEPKHLLDAAVEVANGVIDFFRGRIPVAGAMDKVLNLARKGIQEASQFVGELTEQQIELGMLASESDLTAEQSKSLFDAQKAGETQADLIQRIQAMSSGKPSGDSVVSQEDTILGRLAFGNSGTSRPEPGNSEPASPPPSATPAETSANLSTGENSAPCTSPIGEPPAPVAA